MDKKTGSKIRLFMKNRLLKCFVITFIFTFLTGLTDLLPLSNRYFQKNIDQNDEKKSIQSVLTTVKKYIDHAIVGLDQYYNAINEAKKESESSTIEDELIALNNDDQAVRERFFKVPDEKIRLSIYSSYHCHARHYIALIGPDRYDNNNSLASYPVNDSLLCDSNQLNTRPGQHQGVTKTLTFLKLAINGGMAKARLLDHQRKHSSDPPVAYSENNQPVFNIKQERIEYSYSSVDFEVNRPILIMSNHKYEMSNGPPLRDDLIYLSLLKAIPADRLILQTCSIDYFLNIDKKTDRQFVCSSLSISDNVKI